MKFDRWQYDVDRNRFVNRPAVTIATTIQDDIFINALYLATLQTLVRRVETTWAQAFQELQKRIEGDQ